MASRKVESKSRVQVEAVTHKDKRANIPTEELRDFVADDEKVPKKLRYPRDPTLDPQLVWKGKDEQNAHDLETLAVPIYIQEKIHPQALIEDLRAQSKAGEAAPQTNLFSDFNGIQFEDYIDFYKHGQNWTNRMILGDSLLVMASLAEKEGLKGKVQTIYMDPPYGIKFGSNWQVSTRKRDVKDGKADEVTRQPEQIRAFRDTWQLGIHSYLAYLRDRLTVARELLTESGSIFVQIGDANVHLVRSLLDEVFGTENSVSQIAFKKTSGSTGDFLAGTADYLLWYAKSLEACKYRSVLRIRRIGAEGGEAYASVELSGGLRRRMTAYELSNPESLPPDARPFRLQIVTSARQSRASGPGSAMFFPVTFKSRDYYPSGTSGWRTTALGMVRSLKAGRLEATVGDLSYVRYHDDFPAFPLTNFWDDTQSGSGMDKVYVVQTNARIIERCLLMTTDPGDLVLDPTCGSGTTAYVAEQWGRRWITTDTSRVALALARTRLMAGRYPYYLLADSPEGIEKEAAVTGTVPNRDAKTDSDIKRGFVYKRVPHVTLKSIAQNEEIDAIYAGYQEKLEPLRAELNAALKEKWEEWQIPRTIPRSGEETWPEGAASIHKEWWELRRARQAEIDQSIAKRADTEYLYDQPYEDGKRVRVTGPFTVESLSPHRVLDPSEERPETERAGVRADTAGSFVNVILENLKKAGVQTTVRAERLTFTRLEPVAGLYLHAAGEYEGANGKAQRVAVCVGPQYGTVGPDLVKEAAKEAVQGLGYDVLLVCGFAYDPHVSEEAKRYGKLQVVTAKMNVDLLMGEELLKKTGSGNLFMVFGEPDIDIRAAGDGRDGWMEVEVRGVDVYDPTTQQIRSHSTDDIACWFIDTAYNGESFFVRQAYFTGADDPYEKLKRALRAEVDEGAWASLYATVSRAFERPKTGKIAVKVINHYGDEVLKVFGVQGGDG